MSPTPTPTPPAEDFLTFRDPEDLPGVVARQDDTFFGPIYVSEGNGFIFAGEHREIYVSQYFSDVDIVYLYRYTNHRLEAMATSHLEGA